MPIPSSPQAKVWLDFLELLGLTSLYCSRAFFTPILSALRVWCSTVRYVCGVGSTPLRSSCSLLLPCGYYWQPTRAVIIYLRRNPLQKNLFGTSPLGVIFFFQISSPTMVPCRNSHAVGICSSSLVIAGYVFNIYSLR